MIFVAAFTLLVIVALAIQWVRSDRYYDEEIAEHRRRVLEELEPLPPTWEPQGRTVVAKEAM